MQTDSGWEPTSCRERCDFNKYYTFIPTFFQLCRFSFFFKLCRLGSAFSLSRSIYWMCFQMLLHVIILCNEWRIFVMSRHIFSQRHCKLEFATFCLGIYIQVWFDVKHTIKSVYARFCVQYQFISSVLII